MNQQGQENQATIVPIEVPVGVPVQVPVAIEVPVAIPIEVPVAVPVYVPVQVPAIENTRLEEELKLKKQQEERQNEYIINNENNNNNKIENKDLLTPLLNNEINNNENNVQIFDRKEEDLLNINIDYNNIKTNINNIIEKSKDYIIGEEKEKKYEKPSKYLFNECKQPLVSQALEEEDKKEVKRIENNNNNNNNLNDNIIINEVYDIKKEHKKDVEKNLFHTPLLLSSSLMENLRKYTIGNIFGYYNNKNYNEETPLMKQALEKEDNKNINEQKYHDHDLELKTLSKKAKLNEQFNSEYNNLINKLNNKKNKTLNKTQAENVIKNNNYTSTNIINKIKNTIGFNNNNKKEEIFEQEKLPLIEQALEKEDRKEVHYNNKQVKNDGDYIVNEFYDIKKEHKEVNNNKSSLTSTLINTIKNYTPSIIGGSNNNIVSQEEAPLMKQPLEKEDNKDIKENKYHDHDEELKTLEHKAKLNEEFEQEYDNIYLNKLNEKEEKDQDQDQETLASKSVVSNIKSKISSSFEMIKNHIPYMHNNNNNNNNQNDDLLKNKMNKLNNQLLKEYNNIKLNHVNPIISTDLRTMNEINVVGQAPLSSSTFTDTSFNNSTTTNTLVDNNNRSNYDERVSL